MDRTKRRNQKYVDAGRLTVRQIDLGLVEILERVRSGERPTAWEVFREAAVLAREGSGGRHLAAFLGRQAGATAPVVVAATGVIGTSTTSTSGMTSFTGSSSASRGIEMRAEPKPLTASTTTANANSVNAASGQGNPFQQSLVFRGFAASPPACSGSSRRTRAPALVSSVASAPQLR